MSPVIHGDKQRDKVTSNSATNTSDIPNISASDEVTPVIRISPHKKNIERMLSHELNLMANSSGLRYTKAASVQNLFINRVNEQLITEKAQGAAISTLQKIVNDASDTSAQAHTSVANILSELGTLDVEQKEILIQSENSIKSRIDTLATELHDIEVSQKQQSIHLNAKTDKPETQISFSVTTQDGDKITIDINQNQAEFLNNEITQEGQFAVQYQLEGELSAQEKTALATLYQDFSKFSTALFESPEKRSLSQGIDLNNAFDNNILSGFSISYSGQNEDSISALHESTGRDVVNYNYHIDKQTNSQALAVQIDFKNQVLDLDLNTSLTGSYDEEKVALYINELESNIDQHYQKITDEMAHVEGLKGADFSVEVASKQFLTTSFQGMFQTQTTNSAEIETSAIALNELHGKNGSGLQGSIQSDNQQLSTLADFDLNFIVDKTEKFYYQQKTDITANNNGQKVHQSRAFHATGGFSADLTDSDGLILFLASSMSEHEVTVETDTHGDITRFTLGEYEASHIGQITLHDLNTDLTSFDYRHGYVSQQTNQVTVAGDTLIENYHAQAAEIQSSGFDKWDKNNLNSLYGLHIKHNQELEQMIIRNLSSENNDEKVNVSTKLVSQKLKKYSEIYLSSFEKGDDRIKTQVYLLTGKES